MSSEFTLSVQPFLFVLLRRCTRCERRDDDGALELGVLVSSNVITAVDVMQCGD